MSGLHGALTDTSQKNYQVDAKNGILAACLSFFQAMGDRWENEKFQASV